MTEDYKLKIHWQNKVEKFASEEDRIKGKAQEVIEWESEDEVSLEDALRLGFQPPSTKITKTKEVTQHGNDTRR